MTGSDEKADLKRYLQAARAAMLWKLDGLSDYDIRRPLTPTGTNLLGVIKHLATVETGYFGDVFGRPFGEKLAWVHDDLDSESFDELSPDVLMADMWVTADESRDQITGLYQRVWAHSDATIDALPLDAIGQVPWWPVPHKDATLHRLLVHMIAETHRHAGHADIVRELIDGAAGLREDGSNLPEPADQAWWESYRLTLERVAREASQA
jgi:hypothetical protein